jgi:AcrR family transcriptional regulator
MRALDAFWETGFAATSLDKLVAATGMNRPSLYAAFGDKKSIYLMALSRFSDQLGSALGGALLNDGPVADALTAYLSTALDTYVTDGGRQRGCFAICTAVVEAPSDPDIKSALADVIKRIDGAIELRLRRAKTEGELPQSADPAALARLFGAAQHSLAVRARAGIARRDLDLLARDAVRVILPPP